MSSDHSVVVIASLNIASARRDEEKCSLSTRLDALKEFLVSGSDDHGFDILCLQEIRPSGNMSVSQILVEIGSVLGKNWQVVDMAVNNSTGAFHRATFWDSKKLFHLDSCAIRTKNSREEKYPYMFLFHKFGKVDDSDHKTTFTLINAHAPMALPDKELYWKTVSECSESNTIIVGDMNKFSEHHESYKKYFKTDKLEDKVGLETPTFISFPWDSKADGSPWVSCLDAFITHPETEVSISFVSSHDEFDASMKDPKHLRPTDHFMVVGKATIKSS
jgi:hypothetical protein